MRLAHNEPAAWRRINKK